MKKILLFLLSLSVFAAHAQTTTFKNVDTKGWWKFSGITFTAVSTDSTSTYGSGTKLITERAAKAYARLVGGGADSSLFQTKYRTDTMRTNLYALIGTKEPLITAGTTSQYWRGDKTWQTLQYQTIENGAFGTLTQRRKLWFGHTQFGLIDNPGSDQTEVYITAIDQGVVTGLQDSLNTRQKNITLAAIGASPNANGATLSGGILTFQPASASFGGVVTTGTQTFAGAKTFNSNITVNGVSIGIGGNTTGYQNTALGPNAMAFNTSGHDNTATGYNALGLISSGFRNNANGVNSGVACTSCQDNNLYGYQSGTAINTGYRNSIFGNYAGLNVNTGYDNIFLGYGAGGGITTGHGNLILGWAGTLSSSLSDNIILATGASSGSGLVRAQWDANGRATLTGQDTRYAANYASLYNSRSLVDKNYADSGALAAVNNNATTIIGHHITKVVNGAGDTMHLYADTVASINTQSASYTLTISDQFNRVVEISNASANNLTVPLNSSVAFPLGTSITIVQTGAGQTTFVATGGVTINSSGGKLKLTGQWSSAVLIKTGTNTWTLIGDLTT